MDDVQTGNAASTLAENVAAAGNAENTATETVNNSENSNENIGDTVTDADSDASALLDDAEKGKDETADETNVGSVNQTSKADEPPHPFAAYRGMLFPQCKESYSVRKPEERVISAEAWEWLKLTASVMLENEKLSVDVAGHLATIVNGVIPFGYRVEDQKS